MSAHPDGPLSVDSPLTLSLRSGRHGAAAIAGVCANSLWSPTVEEALRPSGPSAPERTSFARMRGELRSEKYGSPAEVSSRADVADSGTERVRARRTEVAAVIR